MTRLFVPCETYVSELPLFSAGRIGLITENAFGRLELTGEDPGYQGLGDVPFQWPNSAGLVDLSKADSVT